MIGFARTLQAKLLIGLFAGLVLLFSVAIFAMAQLHRSINAYETLLLQDVHIKAEVDALNIDFKRQVQEWKNVLLRGHEQAEREKYWRQFQELHDDIQKRAGVLLKELPDGQFRVRLVQFVDAHRKLLDGYQRGYTLYVDAGFDHRVGDVAVKGIDREPSRLLSEVSKDIEQMTFKLSRQLADRSLQAEVVSIAGLSVVAVVVFVAMFLGLRYLFLRPINQLVEHIDGIASGDFTHRLDFDRDDEIGRLGQSVEQMKRNLAEMLTQIRSTGDTLNNAVRMIAASADDIGQYTAEAETFSGQVATSISQMATTVTDVATSAANAADATQSADKNANVGLAKMENTIRAISALSGDISTIAGDVTKLEQDTTSVGAVLDVIKGIAEQTNLLALNAAIEAARAGEQGRGFAVVADEVRALARRTQESTAEIHHIIETVQNGAAAATQAMREGTDKTRGAAQLAEEAGASIRAITEAVGQIRDMNNQIAAASEEQSVAADEISCNVVNMAELAKSAHSSARDTRGITNELTRAAKELGGLVERFRV